MTFLPSPIGRKIILCLVLILGIFWSGFFFWINRQQNSILLSQLRHQAIGIYHYIVLTRQWISSVGGLYVKIGNDYDKVTPSAFTKAISDFAAQKMPYRIRIAVNNALDPDHLPTEFEKNAIYAFENKKLISYSHIIKKDGHMWFEYAAPLIFENECISCHANRLGKEVLGCISVSFPADSLYTAMSVTKRTFTLYLIISLILMFSLLYLMLRRYVIAPLNSLKDASDQIEKGKLDIQVDLKASSEWEKVASSFNRMVRSLANQQRRLEREVERAVKELSKAYEELKQVERFKSDFFSNITHDLKTPITAIKGAADLMAVRYGNNPEIAPYIDIQQRNIEKLSSMVGNLLDCAKLEAGGLDLHMEHTDLSEVVEDAVLMVIPLAWQKKVELEYRPTDEPILAYVDRIRLEQAISNLLSNAIKFSPEGKPVKISLNNDHEKHAKVTVEDFGPGIPKEEWDQVFIKFFRLPGERASEGIGLGLAIVKGIIEAHGGKVWISQPDHPGVKFNITIPLTRSEDQKES